MGYKHEQFSKKLDQNFQCPICHEIFKEPMTCTAGHTFCGECIQRWLERNNSCPADNTHLNKSSLVPNLTVKGIIGVLDVYCHPVGIENTELSPANKRIKLESSTSDDEGDEENCCWTGKLQELPTHRKTCAFELVSCTFENCKQQVKRIDLEKHKETCKYKKVICMECSSCVVECKLQEHLENDCPKAMVPCENSCSTDGAVTKIRRMDLEEHLTNICAKTMVSCPLLEHGCLVWVERQHVDKHIQGNMAAHMGLLGEKCSAVNKENQLLKDELHDIKEEFHNHRMLMREKCAVLTRGNQLVSNELKNIKDEFHNQLLGNSSYTWVVRNYPYLANNPIGSRIGSPPFWLRGYKWCISLYPNGNGTADATGFLSLYLGKVEEDSQSLTNTMPNTSNNEVAIPYRLTVMSQKFGTDDVSYQTMRVFTKEKNNRGKHKFMKSSDALSTSYCNNGRLIIQCTILPTKPQ